MAKYKQSINQLEQQLHQRTAEVASYHPNKEEKEETKAQNIHDEIDMWLLKAEDALSQNYDDALQYAEKALDLMQYSEHDEKKCYTYYITSRVYSLKGKLNLAFDYITKALEYIKYIQDEYLIHKVHNLTGIIHYSRGEYASALDSFMKALNVIENDEEKYKKDVANLYLNIANIYAQNADYEQSLEILNDALAIFKAQNNQKGAYLCYNTYGKVYIKTNNPAIAKEYYQNALKIAKEINSLKYQATAFNNLSLIAEQRNELDDALKLVRKSLAINQQLSREVVIAIDYRRIGLIYFKMGNKEQGTAFLEKSLQLSLELNSNSEALFTLKELADQCAKAQDWERAYEYRTQYSELRNELVNEEKTKILSELQVKHQLERKKREAELLRANEEQIREYADKLEQSNQDLERFARVASHDMKEPLRMIKSYLSLIKKRVRLQEDKSLHEFLDYAIDGSDRLQQLISDMLKLARVQTKDAPMKPVNMNNVLFMVQNNLSAVIQERKVQFEFDVMPTVHGNMSLLIQLLQNLIGNSIKYNKSQLPIIQIKYKEQAEAHYFQVLDNGIGIKQEYFDKVFDMLVRLHTRTEFEGTGIGLATCKRIVERHEGKIWVSSEEGNGSCFHFTIKK